MLKQIFITFLAHVRRFFVLFYPDLFKYTFFFFLKIYFTFLPNFRRLFYLLDPDPRHIAVILACYTTVVGLHNRSVDSVTIYS